MVVIQSISRGFDRIERVLEKAPQTVNRSRFSWLLSERDKFIGNRQEDGVWRKKLQRKRKKRTGSVWDKRISRIFKGWVGKRAPEQTMYLTQGIINKRKSKFVEGIKLLGSGGTITSTGGRMIVPIYQNLTNKKETHKQFREMRNNGGLFSFRVNNGYLYFKKHGNDIDFTAPLFMAVKSIRVKKQFDFQRTWDRRLPKAMQRGDKRLIKAVERMEKKLGVVE